MHILCTLQYEYNVASVHGTATLISMFDSNAIDFRLDLHSVQTKDYTIVYERFSAKHTPFRGHAQSIYIPNMFISNQATVRKGVNKL